MPKLVLETNVFDAALDRLISVYENDDTVVLAFSAGKDSGICLELCVIAASMTGKLPVHVAMRDEEIMLPGTFEYAERVAARDEIDFHWMIAGQPILNYYNRENPYWWVFDPAEEDKWVRTPPDYARWIDDLDITQFVHPKRFPVAEGKRLINLIGLRASESPNRRLGIFSSKGWLTGADRNGTVVGRPIYDWQDKDVWKAILDNDWDYNHAYDTMVRMGLSLKDQRIAPPTQMPAQLTLLRMASQAWPQWFDKVSARVPGIRTASQYGLVSVSPYRRPGETWQECFYRECVDEAPEWIANRCRYVADAVVKHHNQHSTLPFPEAKACSRCRLLNTWERLARSMFTGDPFSMKQNVLRPIDPEFFRPGTGTWGKGRPTW